MAKGYLNARIKAYAAVEIRDRGPIARGMRRQFNAASKAAWEEASKYFHEHFRDLRFTEAHAKAAGYTARKGERQPPDSKAFRNSYYGRKLRSRFGGGPGLALPLVYTGETRRAARFANVSSTSKGGRIAYPGTQKLNFRHPKSQVRMQEEFRTLLPSEITTLARVYDERLDELLARSDQ